MTHPVTRALIGAALVPVIALILVGAAVLYWAAEKFPRAF